MKESDMSLMNLKSNLANTLFSFAAGSFLLLSSGCATTSHRGEPLPAEHAETAIITGIPNARVWGDRRLPYEERWLAASDKELKARFGGIMNCEHTYLAISGGGADGAFGAGLLAGWSKAGTRPEFTIVTGISTGSLIAPFAFLGPEYDEQLEIIYSQYPTDKMIKMRNVSTVLLKDGLYNVNPIKDMLAHHFNEEVVDAIARESRKGRSLKIGTTNLDTIRPVFWDIGAIARSDHPDRVALIQQIILASCSIPGAFPPVYFDVEIDRQSYDEMHADGGCVNQVFLYPTKMDWPRVLAKLKVQGKPTSYIIRNSRLDPDWQPVRPRITSIVGRSVSSLIRTQGIGDMHRIYHETMRNGLDFNLAYIPPEFTTEANEIFDVEYMKELYALGFELGSKGYNWRKAPPRFEVAQKSPSQD